MLIAGVVWKCFKFMLYAKRKDYVDVRGKAEFT